MEQLKAEFRLGQLVIPVVEEPNMSPGSCCEMCVFRYHMCDDVPCTSWDRHDDNSVYYVPAKEGVSVGASKLEKEGAIANIQSMIDHFEEQISKARAAIEEIGG